ncbi:MAG: hypothetical protein R6W83_03710 [Cryobacterium sp.]
MIIRRAFYHWQFIAAAVLPLWLLVGSAIFGSGGWAVIGVFFGAVILGLSLLVVALVIFARKEVRETRSVSWADVGVLGLWHLLIVSIGFSDNASGWMAVLVVLVGVGVFWFALWELVAAARARMRAMIDLIDQTARTPGTGAPRPSVSPNGFSPSAQTAGSPAPFTPRAEP